MLETAAVVLAAGASMRMGENKLLLRLDGETVVSRAVRVAWEAGLEPIVVVLGHEAERVRAALSRSPCRTVVNPDHARGQGSSLQAGIRAVATSTGAQAAVVMLADMPFVTPAMLGRVAAMAWPVETMTARTPRAPMVVSRYGEVNAPPILYDRALFDELLALPGQACGKEMVRRHRHEARFASWPAEALADLDVPEDYARVLAGPGPLEGAGRGVTVDAGGDARNGKGG